ncbi:hypothetical protein ACJX0J_012533, partial [Zea mays]
MKYVKVIYIVYIINQLVNPGSMPLRDQNKKKNLYFILLTLCGPIEPVRFSHEHIYTIYHLASFLKNEVYIITRAGEVVEVRTIQISFNIEVQFAP